MIRDAVSADEPVLRTIQRDTLVSPWPELLDTAIRTQNSTLDGPRCLVVIPLGSDTPIGYVLAVEGTPTVDQAENESVDRGRDAERGESEGNERCYLAEIAVAAEHRREGYGSALIEAIAERTTADELLLTARADDATARAFYESHDFRVIDRLPDHYDEDGPQDGLLFSKRLCTDRPSPDEVWDRNEH